MHYTIQVLPANRVDLIKPLWKQLNMLHERRSTFFKEHHKTFSFSERKKALLGKDCFRVFTAMDGKQPFGYCIASVMNKHGEIDSLYVETEYRSRGIGKQLMQSAMNWLLKQACVSIGVLVAEGNDDVFPFYKQFGFKPKATLLKMIPEQNRRGEKIHE